MAVLRSRVEDAGPGTTPDDDLVEQLATVIKERIHEPERMPFDDPLWTDEASPDRELAWITRQWASRGAIKPDAWRLRFAVLGLIGSTTTAPLMSTS